MKITFYSSHLGLRGTEVTMYDYAYYGRKFYGWDIQILYNSRNPINHKSTIEKFQKEFGVYSIDCDHQNFKAVNEEIERFLDNHPSDYFYTQKGGENDGVNPRNSKTCILCCAPIDPFKHEHGHRYAFISKWLSDYTSGGKFPVVPSIVYLDDNISDLREELQIPKNATVFGRSGGMDTWDIPFVNSSIIDLINKRDDIYFIFQNTPRFYNHERLIHIEPSSDMELKSKFINTCDALIHARRNGESFGLVCGEFSSKNKRVITFRDSFERNHIEILGNKGLYYSSKEELDSIFMNFHSEPEKDWNCYKDFEPKKVMETFKRIFIDE